MCSIDFIEIGSKGYSFWLPKQILNSKKIKVVYSFGVGENVSFDEELLKRNRDLKIWAFDPTPKAIAYIEKHPIFYNDRFVFSPFGLSKLDGEELFFLPKNEEYVSGSVVKYWGVNGGNSIYVPMRRLSTIMGEQGHTKIDILKMDIEGSEFEVIPDFLKSGVKPKVICVELHERFFSNQVDLKENLIKLICNNDYECFGFGEEYLFLLNGVQW